MYITIAEKVDPYYHRSKIIIHSGNFYFAEFDTLDQLRCFAKTLGFTYKLVGEDETLQFGKLRKFSISHEIDNSVPRFWKISEVPEDAKPIKLLSNGRIVTGYYRNDGETIFIYRPNPNAKEVYKPLGINDHISHKRIYGSY